MRKLLFILFIALGTLTVFSQEKKTFLLTGASFAVPENGWFEIGCHAFGANPINKSVSAEAILQTAMKMYNGKFYTKEELDATDVFVIMHVHNQNVANTEWIKEDYKDYTYSAISTNYPIAYDYVIKKYKDDCYQLKNDAESRYYGTENGKPAVIVLCTHWHDSRTIYNAAIRKLADRWQLPLIKWDENIGFTKDVTDADGKQPSLKYAGDTETIDGIKYGWHPHRGQAQYIQKKMAEIFVAEMEKLLGKIPVTVSVAAKNSIVLPDENVFVNFTFTGMSPWNLTYKIGEQTFSEKNIIENPLKVNIDMPQNSGIAVIPLSVSNSAEPNGSVGQGITINYAEKRIAPGFDTYVHEANKTTAYMDAEVLELKTSSDNYSRQIFLSFDLDEIENTDQVISLRLFFDDLVYSVSNPPKESHLTEISGNTESYTSINWNNRPTDFSKIMEKIIPADDKLSFVSWDVSDWIRQQKEAGVLHVTLRIRVLSGTGLFRFPSAESKYEEKPELVTSTGVVSGMTHGQKETVSVYPNPFTDYLVADNIGEKVSIFSIDGKCLYRADQYRGKRIDTSSFPPGVYIVKGEDSSVSLKVVK